MNAQSLFLVFVSLGTLVSGQLLLKWALGDGDDETGTSGGPLSKRQRVWIFAGGILGMTISFFVNLGLLQKLDLSLIFPFQGLSVLVVTFLASFFLKERLTLPLIIGTLLITVGVMMVSAN